MKHDDLGFDGIGDEEDDIYDEDNDDDDDGDALSSSPSIPDDVNSTSSFAPFFLISICFRTSTLISCMLSILSQPQSKDRQMPQKATCWSSWMTRIAIGGLFALLKITV